MQRTDSRPLYERKLSVTMRVNQLRADLREAEAAQAEIDRLIEEQERAREAAQ
jgi:hypothetical protein